MIAAGEDPRFIARRLIVCAAEDVGNADPNALNVAVNAYKAVELLGLPEGRIPLAQAVIYVARAKNQMKLFVQLTQRLEILNMEMISSTNAPARCALQRC